MVFKKCVGTLCLVFRQHWPPLFQGANTRYSFNARCLCRSDPTVTQAEHFLNCVDVIGERLRLDGRWGRQRKVCYVTSGQWRSQPKILGGKNV